MDGSNELYHARTIAMGNVVTVAPRGVRSCAEVEFLSTIFERKE